MIMMITRKGKGGGAVSFDMQSREDNKRHQSFMEQNESFPILLQNIIVVEFKSKS